MLIELSSYTPPMSSHWQGRRDSLIGERFFQHVSLIDLSQPQPKLQDFKFAIIGFCSDEGIRRNEGRVGAKSGPEAIRRHLGKLAWHKPRPFLDLGDIHCKDTDLEQAQENLAKLIAYSHQQGLKTVVLGGGHEIAWGHFLGLNQHYAKLGIINFDAHFDLRPCLRKNYGSSGTPFWQIAEFCREKNLHFDYTCLGIQEQGNTPSLFKMANSFKVKYLTAECMQTNTYTMQQAFLDEVLARNEAIYLSLCMDVFAECYAPGVSAPQALGISPWQALPLLKYLMQSGKVVSLDIAELSPPLDATEKTARLAGILLAELLESW